MNRIERIDQEFREFLRSPIVNLGLSVGIKDNKKASKWNFTLMGPKDSLYKGGMFFLEMIFPDDYPNKSPTIYFLTPIYHINVNPHTNTNTRVGQVNSNFFKNWNPSRKAKELLIKLYSIFYCPNPDFYYCRDVYNEFTNNKMLYETKAEYFTYKYSNNSKSKNNEEQFSWDFSDNELIAFKRKKEIKEFNYNANEIISISFSILGFEYISILCKLGELTSNVVKRFTDKCALNISGNIICVLNLRKLNLDVPIGENELKDGSEITFIYDS